MGNYWSAQVTEEKMYGWKRDIPSESDVYHNFNISKLHDTIKGVDLRDKFPPVYDQGKLGSCTANGIAGAYEFDEMKQKAVAMGFEHAACGPFVRSSYHADLQAQGMEVK